ncbi:hypothetical protein ACFQJ5_12515 [Halomicroarcula sp. GCM10025324]|uniref:hypothetical protein n=1 Tax=Haloarcula TaxID=2237 RepID=UPI0023E76FEC|nr:hypothetical protein [Halomicroarcula sp. ZS-22-S1]
MTSPDRTALAKATLFCPDCGHRSRYDGDWLVVERTGTRALHCPECHTTVIARSTGESPVSPTTLWDRWTENLRTWQDFWWQRLTP